MKKHLVALTALIIGFSLSIVHAQPGMMRGGMGVPGPRIGAATTKIFGDNPAFTANMEFHAISGGQDMTMPGKFAFLDGKSRFEMDMSEMKGGHMSPQAAEHMKQMGMDKTVSISRPDLKLTYIVYPGLQAYVANAIQDPDAAKPESDFKMDVTKLGEEKVDGHDCVKNKVVVTDSEGTTHTSTVWNATDLKKFPVKIETIENGTTATMLFKDVKLSKPDAAQFEPPSDFKKYDSVMSLMQQEMMKRMGGGMGAPPQH